MIRLTQMSGTWYALKIELYDDIENINQFVSEGVTVVLCEDMESAAEFLDVDEDDINLVA